MVLGLRFTRDSIDHPAIMIGPIAGGSLSYLYLHVTAGRNRQERKSQPLTHFPQSASHLYIGLFLSHWIKRPHRALSLIYISVPLASFLYILS